jgi:cation:H+ antiporter
MFFINIAVDVLIESIKHMRSVGTIVGFITNTPEALCLIVGLFSGDILYAASTPLGSNIMNPIVLCWAALSTGQISTAFGGKSKKYVISAVVITVALAITLMKLPPHLYSEWLALALLASGVLFIARPNSPADIIEPGPNPLWYVLPAGLLLAIAGYLLDPVIVFTSEKAVIPKAGIGFFALALLTSWPEFRSTKVLLEEKQYISAQLNIVVSNITNLWLASVGIIVLLFF